MKNNQVITRSEIETERLGKTFAQELQPQDVVCLIGELGAGKTTFVKGLAKGLGIKARITSPTYVVVREHEIQGKGGRVKGEGIERLYHLDLYRLTSEKDVLGINIHDLLKDKNVVTVIEWPEVARSLIPSHAWIITFEQTDKNHREITIQRKSP